MRAFPRHLACGFRELIFLNLSGRCAADTAWLQQMQADLSKYLSPRRGQAARRKVAKSKKAERREKTASVREQVVARADGVCECGACYLNVNAAGQTGFAEGHLDHFFGGSARRSSESVETCWLLSPTCHAQKTLNSPSAEDWTRRFIEHCATHGYYAAKWRAGRLLQKQIDRAALDSMRTGGAL